MLPGLVRLYAIESGQPEISKTKREGLAQHYGVGDGAGNEYFAVHEETDVEHAAEGRAMIARHLDGASEDELVAVAESTFRAEPGAGSTASEARVVCKGPERGHSSRAGRSRSSHRGPIRLRGRASRAPPQAPRTGARPGRRNPARRPPRDRRRRRLRLPRQRGDHRRAADIGRAAPAPPPARSAQAGEAEAREAGARDPDCRGDRGGAPPASGPVKLDFRRGDEVRFRIDTDAGDRDRDTRIRNQRDGGLGGTGGLQGDTAGQFPVIVAASHINIASLNIR